VLILALAICIAASAAAGAAPARERVMVGLVDLPGPADVAAIRALGGTVHTAYAHFPLLAAELPAPAIARLARNPRVRYVEPDQVRYAVSQTLPWGVDHIDADIAWSTTQGAGAKLAVLRILLHQGKSPDARESLRRAPGALLGSLLNHALSP